MAIGKHKAYALVNRGLARLAAWRGYNRQMAKLATFAERFTYARTDLRKARGMRPLSLEAIGDALDPPITKPSVARWENGGFPEEKRRDQIARVLGVRKAWLFDGDGLPEQVSNAIVPQSVTGGRAVPIVNPSDLVEDVDLAISNAKEQFQVYGESGARVMWLPVQDNANLGEFNAGDIVAIDPDQHANPGDWCAARIIAERRIAIGVLVTKRADGRLSRVLETSNPKWADEELSEADEIVGPILHHNRRMRK